jgi:hypothetical protein
MIRAILPADTPALVALSGSSGLFKADELYAIQEMLDEYHATNAANGHIITYEEDAELLGIAYFRMLLIETSDKSSFERTRLFYRKHQYTEVAHIPDYFTDGDGKASFIKRV